MEGSARARRTIAGDVNGPRAADLDDAPAAGVDDRPLHRQVARLAAAGRGNAALARPGLRAPAPLHGGGPPGVAARAGGAARPGRAGPAPRAGAVPGRLRVVLRHAL